MTSDTFLRLILWLDAATCTIFGLGLLVLGGLVETYLGIPRAVHLAAVAILVPATAIMIGTASRNAMPEAGVMLVIIGNVLWVLASLWLAVSGVVAPTTLGIVFLLVQAAAVGAIAWLEWSGLRRVTARAET